MPDGAINLPLGKPVPMPGHFDTPVVLEEVRRLSAGYECRVRLPNGSLDEVVISSEEAAALATQGGAPQALRLVNPSDLQLLVESARIRLAYAHDRQFAVSLSGIRTLPHQVEAVYQRMLPQPCLRFLLADDPGAGKTIMAGLLIKEMKLREAIDRVLILCPAPLTIQWQDEMQRWFGETFDMIFAAVDQQQLSNPWQRSSQVVASLDYAKQDDVRERIWQQRWELLGVEGERHGHGVAVGEQPLTIQVLEVFLEPAQRPRTVVSQPEDVVANIRGLRAEAMWFREQVWVEQPQEMSKLVLVAVMRGRRQEHDVLALGGQTACQFVTFGGNDPGGAPDAAATRASGALMGFVDNQSCEVVRWGCRCRPIPAMP